MEIFRTFTFDAAHRLPNVPPGHKCARVHGHTYTLTVYVSGPVNETTGWIMDFGELTAAVQPVLEELDHRYLNDIQGLENSTSENLARWLWKRLKPRLPGLSRLIIHETRNSGCEYRGE